MNMMTRVFLGVSILVGAAAPIACGTSIDLDQYGTACRVDDDCRVVPDDACGCPNVAINVGDLPDYAKDIRSKEGFCPEVDQVRCPQQFAVCINEVCEAVAPAL